MPGKAAQPKKNKGGRPKKQLDYATIEKLAHIHCTQEEIATIIGVHVRTLQRDKEFCRIYKKGTEGGKASLRRMQWKTAEGGSATMQIWLGKQILGQTDKDKVDHDGSIDVRVIYANDNGRGKGK